MSYLHSQHLRHGDRHGPAGERGGRRRRGALRLAPRVRDHVHRGRRLPPGLHGRPDPRQLRLRRADPGRGMRVAPRGNPPRVRALARAGHGQGAAGTRVAGTRAHHRARRRGPRVHRHQDHRGIHRAVLRAVLGRITRRDRVGKDVRRASSATSSTAPLSSSSSSRVSASCRCWCCRGRCRRPAPGVGSSRCCGSASDTSSVSPRLDRSRRPRTIRRGYRARAASAISANASWHPKRRRRLKVNAWTPTPWRTMPTGRY